MKHYRPRPTKISVAVWTTCLAAVCGLYSTSGLAFEITTPNPDIDMHWDNTVRGDYGMRLQGRDGFYTNSPTYDESDLSTSKFGTIQARLNLYSEFDFKYKDNWGFRVSAAAWYDPSYRSHVNNNTSLPSPNNLPNYPGNTYSSYIEKYYGGPSGELRDAFVFGSFNLGDHPVDVKLGRTAITWGQAAFATIGGTNSIAFAQQPIDLYKATISPSASLKEVVLPTTQTVVSTKLTDTITLAAQYTFEWDYDRIPEGGTYFGGADAILYGPPVAAYTAIPGLGPVPLNRVAPIKGQQGDIGVDGKWRIDAIGSTAEVAFRHFAMKFPWAALVAPGRGVNLGPVTLPGIQAQYGNDVNLVGAGINGPVGNAAYAAEISYRWNMPLSPTSTTTINNAPTGRTLHGLFNLTQSVGKTPFWDNMFVQGEFAFNRLMSVQKNPGNLALSGYDTSGQCSGSGNNPYNNCASRFWMGMGIGASPQWYQVFPGVDLTVPLFINLNLKGYSPVINNAGESQGFNTFLIGLNFNIHNKHEIDITYTYYTNKKGFSSGGAAAAVGAPYSDKSWLGITYQTTF
ncbi:DUF1302 domain-containing protein [Paraburkholderia sp. BL25I1N1]|uniref:DUF1302 domain-containing protein n=1 Tax=Paraburkholderia sp. BL25I1N1 TaxID=1938804 RepID=UPI000D04FFEF|nr:DUF1302 family protein [Paraburkholderia sp. BL25I1N1]PRX96918.1 uncharacterized protein DUF1302 [Paraburkholderia sp. BL25I1N1]